LDLLLDELRVERLLLTGGATEACVVQTGIDARERGYKVTILADACATLNEQIERVALRYADEVAGMMIEPERLGERGGRRRRGAGRWVARRRADGRRCGPSSCCGRGGADRERRLALAGVDSERRV